MDKKYTLLLRERELTSSQDLQDLFETLETIVYFRNSHGVFYIKIDGNIYNHFGYTRDQLKKILAHEILKEK